jgi:hypothetical protein
VLTRVSLTIKDIDQASRRCISVKENTVSECIERVMIQSLILRTEESNNREITRKHIVPRGRLPKEGTTETGNYPSSS